MPYAKRSVLSGFPIETGFESRDEIDAYLSGDRVTCLRCGHSYRILETHLRGVHGMTGDDYREKYGLPFERGLCASDFSAQRVEHGRNLFAENHARQSAAMDKARAVQREQGGNPQRHKPKFWKMERTKYTREHFEEFARRVMAGRTGLEVEQDEDMPCKQHVLWYMKRDKDFATKWAAVVRPLAKTGLNRSDRVKAGLVVPAHYSKLHRDQAEEIDRLKASLPPA